MRWRIRTGDGGSLAGAALSLALLVSAPACARPAEGQALELLAFSQRDVASVALNEELLFYFSADLDRTSITTGSVRVIDERGGEVPGARIVRGNALSFLPDLPRSPDLSDGGLQPGMLYRVVLGGFPRPDGIRSRSGALLSAAMTLSFRTAARGESQLFVDPFFEPSPLVPRGEHRRAQEVVVAEGRMELECGEALDPLSIGPQGFDLLRFPEGSGVEEVEPTPVPIRVRLAVNRREQALLVIEPADRPAFELGDYYLSLTELGPRTLGGRRVEAGWPGVLKVMFRAPRFDIDLTVPQGGSTAPPPGCDGTAMWSAQGLTIRYPAAAGSGADGPRELSEAPEGNDVHATRLVVPGGASIALGDRQGPLVLRSQGTLEVAGKLSRIGSVFHPKEPLSVELHAALSRAPSEWAKLGPWVERLLTPDAQWSREPWTVLIAGGDLVVPRGGEIEVDGPLLLAAGGWIRVEGSVVAREVWRTPEGGGNIAGRVGLESFGGGLQLLPLVLEPPTVNPLRQRLRVGVLTRLFPLPQLSGSIWIAELTREGKGGQEDVEFLEHRDGSLASVGRAIDPARQSGRECRALIQLSMPAGDGEPWDPPRLLRFEFKPLPPAEESPRRP